MCDADCMDSLCMIVVISQHERSVTGGHKRLDRLVSHLADSANRLMWITPKRQGWSPCCDAHVVPRPVSFPGVPTGLSFLVGITKHAYEIRKVRDDVKLVVTFGETTIPAALFVSFLTGAPLSLGVRANVPKRRYFNRKNVGALRAQLYRVRDFFFHRMLRYAYRRSVQVVVQTHQARQQLCDYYAIPPLDVTVLGNDIPSEARVEMEKKEFAKSPIRVLFVGNSSAIKGVDILLQSLKHLPETDVSIREATLVGRGIEKQAAAIDSTVRINCIEWSGAVFELMRTHDLLIVPSREDQFPNVVLEAMAVGLPVIGSDVDGIAHMLQEQFVLFPPGDVGGLLQSMVRVSKPHGYALARRIINERRHKFLFDWCERYCDLLSQVMR